MCNKITECVTLNVRFQTVKTSGAERWHQVHYVSLPLAVNTNGSPDNVEL